MLARGLVWETNLVLLQYSLFAVIYTLPWYQQVTVECRAWIATSLIRVAVYTPSCNNSHSRTSPALWALLLTYPFWTSDKLLQRNKWEEKL